MPAARRLPLAVGALVIGASLTACGHHASVAPPHPSGAEAAACASFMAALPATLADQPRESGGARYQASYGSPSIVVSCGVGAPAGFGVGAECQVANRVGWYLSPDKAYADQSLDITVTAAGYRPRVAAFVPARYRPAAVAAVMAELAAGVRKYFTKTTGCV